MKDLLPTKLISNRSQSHCRNNQLTTLYLELLPLLLFLDNFLSGVRLLDLCLLTGLRLGGVRERLLACTTGLRDRPRFRTGLTALRLQLSWPNPRPC